MLLPGAANALAARVIAASGFEAVYVTGAGIANTYLGVPDLGLVSISELAEHVAAIRETVELPLVVDGDTGFGNALNMRRTKVQDKDSDGNISTNVTETQTRRWMAPDQ